MVCIFINLAERVGATIRVPMKTNIKIHPTINRCALSKYYAVEHIPAFIWAKSKSA
jgi:hypothetical protein